MIDPFRALYLHVPFCVRRCAYCDFHTQAIAPGDARMRAHVDGLVESIKAAADAGLLEDVETAYVGGGTPTHLGPALFDRLLASIGDGLMPGLAELTVEANPESLMSDASGMFAALAAHGVNRLSIGVQSLDDAVLETLGRAHDSRRALEVVEAAVGRIGNVSADVICGVPGQTEASVRSTVEALVEAGVVHASIYPLMVEEGTPIAAAIGRGDLPDVDDDAQADHMLAAEEVLVQAGFHRYEVASYARPGFESRHNTAYWCGVPYLGLGDGASSMFDARDAEGVFASGAFGGDFLRSVGSGHIPAFAEGDARIRVGLQGGKPELEGLTAREAACEDAMLAMRMSRGLARGRLAQFEAAAPGLGEAADRAVGLGLARWEGGRLMPTSLGWLNGNELYALFWDCASV